MAFITFLSFIHFISLADVGTNKYVIRKSVNVEEVAPSGFPSGLSWFWDGLTVMIHAKHNVYSPVED